MIAALVVAAAIGVQEPRYELRRFSVVGELDRLSWWRGDHPPTTLEMRLQPGEVGDIVYPIQPSLLPEPPEASDDGADGDGGVVPRPEGASSIPPELRQRTRPPVGPQEPRPDAIALLLLVASGLLVVATRRRPGIALAVGAFGAVAVGWSQSRSAPPEPERIRVLEGAGSDWVLVEGAARKLSFEATTDIDLRTEPERAPIQFRGVEGRSGQLRVADWTAHVPGLVWRRAALDPGARRVAGGLNLWGNFSFAWSRTPDGTWRAHGPWELGQPLGESSMEAPAPPGWLASGLPQGRSVLVGRLAEDAWRGPDGHGGPASATWLRWID